MECRKCHKEKPLEDFPVEKSGGKEYRRKTCKACRLEKTDVAA